MHASGACILWIVLASCSSPDLPHRGTRLVEHAHAARSGERGQPSEEERRKPPADWYEVLAAPTSSVSPYLYVFQDDVGVWRCLATTCERFSPKGAITATVSLPCPARA
jgi:hypothetical protein